jgi:hypothetical protein
MAVKRNSGDSKSRNSRLGLPESFATRAGSRTSGSNFEEDNMRESYFKTDKDNSSKSAIKQKLSALSQASLLQTRRSVAVITAVITVVLTLGFSSLFATNSLDSTTLAARISGGVALSESELKDVVAKLGETVYWVGGERGAKYTINAQNVGAIYVRYLPDGKGISDNAPKYRVIATYKEANAYDATLAAGNQANGVSVARPDKTGVIYYNKNTPTNVYLAFKAQPFQIEIFDPSAETSLSLANDDAKIQAIK